MKGLSGNHFEFGFQVGEYRDFATGIFHQVVILEDSLIPLIHQLLECLAQLLTGFV